ncbi:Ig-like domain-containing protein [Brevibacillus dissolubilis]|uniref:Ig-like domain-containing protein n=1 Tax=Brevibacillus dissolubilis TaxID=1844116 RepID=UPI0011165F82|nr:Ig-like domain-containing protein [Brevibacillus dissolubilis]
MKKIDRIIRTSALVFTLLHQPFIALAQTPGAKVSILDVTDKKPGETITIAGSSTYSTTIFKVISPEQTIAYYDIMSGNVVNFSKSFTLPATATPGVYTIVIGRGTDVATDTFELIATPTEPPTTPTDPPTEPPTTPTDPPTEPPTTPTDPPTEPPTTPTDPPTEPPTTPTDPPTEPPTTPTDPPTEPPTTPTDPPTEPPTTPTEPPTTPTDPPTEPPTTPTDPPTEPPTTPTDPPTEPPTTPTDPPTEPPTTPTDPPTEPPTTPTDPPTEPPTTPTDPPTEPPTIPPYPPTEPPTSPTIPTEFPTTVDEQRALNDYVIANMQASRDREIIFQQGRLAINGLASYVYHDRQFTNKFAMVNETITTVFGTLVDEMNDQDIKDEAVASITQEMLNHVLIPMLMDVEPTDTATVHEALTTFENLLETVISELKPKAVDGWLADHLNICVLTLIGHVSQVPQNQSNEIAELTAQIAAVQEMIARFEAKMGDSADLVIVDPFVQYELTDANATLTLDSNAVQQLAVHDYGFTVKSADGNAVTLPTELLDNYQDQDLRLQFADTTNGISARGVLDVAGTVIDTYTAGIQPDGKTSDTFQVLLYAGDRRITQLHDQEALRITIPFESTKNLYASYYDEKTKKWNILADGNMAKEVTVQNHSASFTTSQLAPHRLEEVTVSRISFADRKLTLFPGAAYPLSVVTAVPGTSYRLDLSGTDKGTSYTSSDTDVATINEDGVVTVNPEAKAGTRVTITAENNKKTSKMTLTVQPLYAIKLEPRSLKVKAGESTTLTVTAYLSDKSKLDVTTHGVVYESSNQDIATIDDNGVLTVNAKAKAGDKVTLEATYQGKTSRVQLTVH